VHSGSEKGVGESKRGFFRDLIERIKRWSAVSIIRFIASVVLALTYIVLIPLYIFCKVNGVSLIEFWANSIFARFSLRIFLLVLTSVSATSVTLIFLLQKIFDLVKDKARTVGRIILLILRSILAFVGAFVVHAIIVVLLFPMKTEVEEPPATVEPVAPTQEVSAAPIVKVEPAADTPVHSDAHLPAEKAPTTSGAVETTDNVKAAATHSATDKGHEESDEEGSAPSLNFSLYFGLLIPFFAYLAL